MTVLLVRAILVGSVVTLGYLLVALAVFQSARAAMRHNAIRDLREHE